MAGVRADAVETAVPVPGGRLAATRWPAAGPVVLAVHGITGNSLSWVPVVDRLADFDVVAPDLRGRAHSRDVTGPYGLVRHADDVAALADEVAGSEPVVLVGHSMGAFVACVAAVRHPERFARLVLVDGGYDFGVVVGDRNMDDVLTEVIGPSMRRLSLEFETPQAYCEFWQRHPAFTDIWNDDTEAHIRRDLIGEPPHLRSSCVLDAIRTDGRDVFLDKEVHAAIHHLPVPATLLWAQRGLLDEPVGLYTAQSLAAAGLPDNVDVRAVPDTNHFSIVLGAAGADAVAAAVRG